MHENYKKVNPESLKKNIKKAQSKRHTLPDDPAEAMQVLESDRLDKRSNEFRQLKTIEKLAKEAPNALEVQTLSSEIAVLSKVITKMQEKMVSTFYIPDPEMEAHFIKLTTARRKALERLEKIQPKEGVPGKENVINGDVNAILIANRHEDE